MSMPAAENGSLILEGLNCEQRQAVQHGDRPLLIVAGAGTGKTKTLVHRVAQQIQQGIAPGRILLLTFTRRAAAEMLRRVDGLLRQLHGNGRQHGGGSQIQAIWGGTFHAIATRMLRLYAPAAGLEPAFTILDRGDSEDLLDVVRTELGLSKTDQRFPRKGTCLAIYSHCVNAQQPLDDVLAAQFPWCREQAADLKRLFAAYGERKNRAASWTMTICCCSGAGCWPIRRPVPRSAAGSTVCWWTSTKTRTGSKRKSSSCCGRTATA